MAYLHISHYSVAFAKEFATFYTVNLCARQQWHTFYVADVKSFKIALSHHKLISHYGSVLHKLTSNLHTKMLSLNLI